MLQLGFEELKQLHCCKWRVNVMYLDIHKDKSALGTLSPASPVPMEVSASGCIAPVQFCLMYELLDAQALYGASSAGANRTSVACSESRN